MAQPIARVALFCFAAGSTFWTASGAAAEAAPANYPARPIRFIVPSSPGGGTDITARLIAARLTERLGQQVIIDNRPGAAGSIGTELAARAAPDGHSLLAFAATAVATAATRKNLPYDLTRDFTPVTQTTSLPYLLVTHQSLAVKTVNDLVALARAKPGSLTYGSSGTGGLSHLAGGLLAQLTDTNLVHVPYKGGATALADVLAGRISMLFSSPLQAGTHLRSGKLRALAVTTRTRLSRMPELPTMIEAGLPNYEVNVWNGIIGPAGIPGAIVNKLFLETAQVLQGLKGPLAADGSEVVASPPHAFGVYIKSEVAKWRKTVEQIGLRLE